MKNKKLIFGLFTCLSLFAIGTFVLPDIGLAQAQDSLEAVGETTGLGTTDIRIVVARIIRAGLGILGILAVCIIVYAGYLWMTAGGNAERVDRAKRLLINGLIGLIIIFASVAIVQFVISAVLRSTGAGGDGGGDGGCPTCLGGDATIGFVVENFVPQTPDDAPLPIRNVVARAFFSRSVDAATLENQIQVFNADTATEIPFTYELSGRTVKIVPEEACPAPNEDRFCYPINTKIKVQILEGVESTSGAELQCQSGTYPCEFYFTTGELVDIAPPTIDITDPYSGKRFLKADPLPVQVHVTDDAMISGVDFFAEDELFSTESPDGMVTDALLGTFWDASLFADNANYGLTSMAYDIADNSAEDSVSVHINPAHCGNGVQDEDETGLNCGGSCGACVNNYCDTDLDCAAGHCVDNKCTAVPEITSVSPGDGKVGSWILISGTSFGFTQGQVFFSGAQGTLLAATVVECSDGWWDDSVLVEVPEGTVDGPIILRTSNGSEDSTAYVEGGYGPTITDFVVSETVRPGLCRIAPRTAQPRKEVGVIGRDFGDDQGSGYVFFDKEEGSFAAVRPPTYNAWTNGQVTIPVPALGEDDYTVSLVQDGVESNPVPFYLRFATDSDVATEPRIDKIEPDNGAIGAYITLSGVNFGDQLGQVWFENKSDSSARALGTIDFPSACSIEDIWRTDQVIVKVPSKYSNNTDVLPGEFSVAIQRQDAVKSSPVDFEITTGEPGPGICAIKPSQGLEGDPAVVYGERLGAPGSILFPNSVLATIESWTSTSIDIEVPDSVSGKVFLRSADQVQSEQGVNFSYGAGATPVVEAPQVSGYGWRFSTGVIPEVPGVITACNDTVRSAIPNEQFNDDVCRNARIYVAFTTDMSTSSLVFGNGFNVYKCNSATACGANQRTVANGDFVLDFDPESVGVGAPAVGATRAFRLTPKEDLGRQGQYLLTPNTRYRVEIMGGATGVKSSGGEPMPETVGWEFSVGGEDDICSVEDVLVQPSAGFIKVEGGTKGFVAGGFGRSCIWLTGAYSWGWSSDASVATLSACTNPPEDDPLSCKVATATGDGVTNISAFEPMSGRSDSAELTVAFEEPYVKDTWPRCDGACMNALVGGRFNVPVKLDTGDHGLLRSNQLGSTMVGLAACDNELCTNTAPLNVTVQCKASSVVRVPDTSFGEPGCTEFSIVGANLQPNTFYEAYVSSDLWSTSEKPLTRLNDSLGYSWIFSTSEENQVCAVDSILVTPGEAIATEVGGRQTFTAEPSSEPDHCSVAGQRLDPAGYSWNWIAPAAGNMIAQWVKPGGEFFHTTPGDGVFGCTSNCLSIGSIARAAVCGNGALESPWEECEDGNSDNGDGCSSTCLREPSDPGQCWDGALDRIDFETDGNPLTFGYIGEECDDGDISTCTAGDVTKIGLACAGPDDCSSKNESGVSNNDGVCTSAPVSGDGCSVGCQNEGSIYVGAVCGNGDIAYSFERGGEDCDDGNRSSGDGCSSACVREGSISPIEQPAVCGDGIIQTPYETCDDDNLTNGDGCSDHCVREGARADAYRASCGDGQRDYDSDTEAGEDCDGGEGCSVACLFEGSSLAYNEPSICGDGFTGKGEVGACETSIARNPNISSSQIAEILDTAPEEIVEGAVSVETEVSVKIDDYPDEQGDAKYALQCGAVTDDDCRDPVAQGVGIGGCCALRPNVTSHFPQGPSVCRNVLPHFIVDREINVESAKSSTYITYQGAESCASLPAGHTTVARVEDRQLRPLLSFGRRVFRMIVPVISAQVVGDCIVPIQTVVQQAEGNSYRVDLVTGVLLAPETEYSFSILSDHTLNDGNVDGLRSRLNVRMKDDYAPEGATGTFTTGKDICEIDYVDVTDPDGNPEGFFAVAGDAGKRDFKATAYSLNQGVPSALQPIAGVYTWAWTDWQSDNEEVVTVDPNFSTSTVISTATIIPQTENGEAVLVASLQTSGSAASHVCSGGVNTGKACVVGIASDCPQAAGETAACVGRSVVGMKPVATFFCEAPWPSITTFPFEDTGPVIVDTDRNKDGILIGPGTGEWTNFGTYYCRDAGVDGPNEDLPNLRVVQPPSLPGISGIQKEFLFEVQDTEYAVFRGDVIGLRVISNPSYLSASEWYNSQGFEGSPQILKVDGFDAVRDGRTLYIASARMKDGVLRPNIYILSYNQNASTETTQIFDQLISNFNLLADIADGSPKVCAGAGVAGKACVSDIDCGTAGVCLDNKGKIARDMQRLTDVNRYARSIETYAAQNGTCSATTTKACKLSADCPQGESCVPLVPSLAAGTFVPGLVASTWPSWSTILGGEIPGIGTDPINRYVSNEEGVPTCPGGTKENGTCYNEPSRTYVCKEGSHVYHFTRESGVADKSYRLIASLEYGQAKWEYAVPTYSLGIVEFDVDPNTAGALPAGFVKSPQYCNDSARGGSSICGDGIVGGTETCEVGQITGTRDCSLPDGPDAGTEADVGKLTQRCAASCRAVEDQPGAICAPAVCNNGVIDPGEECDDGVDNGRYGFCSSTCKYSDAPRCGDSKLDAGEACDCGVVNDGIAGGIASGGQGCAAAQYNGAYSPVAGQSCSWDCRGPAAFCGDRIKNGSEVCDGNVEIVMPNTCVPAQVCQAGDTAKIGLVCNEVGEMYNATDEDEEEDNDSDCDSVVNGIKQGDGQCSPAPVERVQTQACGGPSSATACQLGSASPCMPATTCGNGSVEAGEMCDDGNRENGDVCTNVCRLNVCGDNMVFQGVETCDNGIDNGKVCDARYDANCTYCASNCSLVARSGAYCGDGFRQQPAELCDGSQMPLQRVNINGVVGGTCELSQIHNPSTIQDAKASCEYVGLCDGGDRNGKACIFASATTDTDFGGLSCGFGIACVPPECKDDCQGMCPFNYDSQNLAFTGQFEGASRQEAITLIKEDLFAEQEEGFTDTQSTFAAARVNMHVPACRQMGSWVGSVDFSEGPQKTYVMFVNDLSDSMAGTRMTTLVDVLKSSVDTLFHELGTNVEIGLVEFGSKQAIAHSASMNTDIDGANGIEMNQAPALKYNGKTWMDLIDQNLDMTNPSEADRLNKAKIAFTSGANGPDFFLGEGQKSLLVETINSYAESESTYTSLGLMHAFYGHLENQVDHASETGARRVVVLMTDGIYRGGYAPGYFACAMQEAGIEMYTFNLGTSVQSAINPTPGDCGFTDGEQYLDDYSDWHGGLGHLAEVGSCRELISRESMSSDQNNLMSCISSGNTGGKFDFDYAFAGETKDEFQSAYDAILASIIGARATYTIGVNPDGSAIRSTVDIKEGSNIEIPLPAGFSCTNEEQIIPLTINYAREGTVTLSNVRANMCKQ